MASLQKTFNHQHQTHQETAIKFILLTLLVGLYIGYLSWKFDATTGVHLAVLTWSFFVLCTPVSDGGFLFAFPLRLLFGFKMATTQIFIWLSAVGFNVYMVLTHASVYQFTLITKLLYKFITHPYPYWGILFICLIGTIYSVKFGDEMLDMTKHSERVKHHKHGFKYRIILVLGILLLTVAAYYEFIHLMHIHILQ